MLLTTVLAAALLSAPFQQTRDSSPLAQTSPETAETVEILRRVLVDALDEAFDEEDGKQKGVYSFSQGVEVDGIVTNLWAGGRTVQHARAFHVPGSGLFLALDATLPVVSKEAPEEPARGDAPANDEWERARREVRGAGRGGFVQRLHATRPSTESEIDPRAVDELVSVALRTLGRHALRVEGLGARDTVTLAVRISGRTRSWLETPEMITPDAWHLEEIEPDGAAPRPELKARSLTSVFLATSADVREQNLVVQIALADLTAPNATAEQLLRVARVNRY